jgi:hypothetical protein
LGARRAGIAGAEVLSSINLPGRSVLMKTLLSAAVTAALLLPMAGQASGLVIGTPGGGNCFPFGCATGSRYQQVYAAAQFALPMDIESITFYASSGEIADGHYSLFLSTTAAAVDALSPTFDDNPGADAAAFANFSGGAPVGPNFTVNGSNFHYDPGAGNLLLDIRITGNSGSGTVYFDSANGDAGGVFSRMHDFGSGFEGFGLVTGFNIGPTPPVPEPGTTALWGAGLALAALAGRRRRVRPHASA